MADYDKERINKKDYFVHWKSAQSNGMTDKVAMKITAGVPDSIRTRLTVESSTGGLLNYNFNAQDSTWEVIVNGQPHENEDRITAYYTQDDGTKIAVGHLNLASYNKQDMKLVIVPVGDKYGYDKNPSYHQFKTYIDNIYKSAITFWDVSISDPLAVDYEDNKTKGVDTKLPDLAAYTREMKNIRNAMRKRSDYNRKAYYLFLVDKSEDGAKNGIMPFKRHFGFIFMNNSENLQGNQEKMYHTMAHELGHGPFGLEHPWDEKGTTQGATHNLMDYTDKKPDNLLRKYQWYYIHNPKSSWFGGNEEEVASTNNINNYILMFGVDGQPYYIYKPEGDIETIFKEKLKATYGASLYDPIRISISDGISLELIQATTRFRFLKLAKIGETGKLYPREGVILYNNEEYPGLDELKKKLLEENNVGATIQLKCYADKDKKGGLIDFGEIKLLEKQGQTVSCSAKTGQLQNDAEGIDDFMLVNASFCETQSIYSDETVQEYIAPHYVQEKQSKPIAYIKGSKLIVSPVFKLSKTFDTNTEIKIRGKIGQLDGNNEYEFELSETTANIETIDENKYATCNGIQSLAAFPDYAYMYKPLKISWQIYNGTGWQNAGESNNTVYVLNKKPEISQEPLFQTVVDIGCRNLMEKKTSLNDLQIVDVIWEDFKKQVGEPFPMVKNYKGEVLTYWKYPKISEDFTYVKELLAAKDGTCTTWARLFHQVLLAKG